MRNFKARITKLEKNIKHRKKLPTPYKLITKGEILYKYSDDGADPVYYIAWDKTDDIYSCGFMLAKAACYLIEQETRLLPK